MATRTEPFSEGSSSHEDLVQKIHVWLQVAPTPDGQFSCTKLLGVGPRASRQEILGALDARLLLLTGYLQGPDDKIARHAMHMVQSASDKLIKKLDDSPVAAQQDALHDAFSDLVPETVLRRKKKTAPAGMLARLKNNKLVAYGAAGVVAAAAAVFGVSKMQTSSPEQPATPAKLVLPENAPELTKSVVPPPPPVPEKTATVVPPPPEKPVVPAPAPEVPVIPEIPAPPKAEQTSVAQTPLPADPAPEKPAADTPASPTRSSVPSKETIDPELLQSPTLAKQSVEQLIEQAQRSKDHTVQWTLLRIALNNAQAGHNLDHVMTVLSEMQKYFDIDDDVIEKGKVAVLNALQHGEDAEQVMLHASSIVRSMCMRNSFAEARKFIASLNKALPLPHKKESLDISRMVTQLQKTYDKENIAEYQDTLAKDPKNQEANQAVGTYHCLEEGDWSFSSALRLAHDPVLRDLAARVERREMFSSEELLQLSKELLRVRTPAGPGTIAMAMHCLELAQPKSNDALLTARIKDLLAELKGRHTSVLPFFRGTLLRPPSATSTATANVSIDVTNALPPGTVDLMGENLAELFKQKVIMRDRWEVVQEAGKDKKKPGKALLKGFSGHHSWAASIQLPLPEEGKKIVQSGRYTVRFVFRRTGDGRKPENFQGTTTFIVPLPNGQGLPVVWDRNMEQNNPGTYRSHFDADFPTGKQININASVNHGRPVVIESKKEEYVCLVTVRTTPDGPMLINAKIAGDHGRQPLGSLSVAAPKTLNGKPYFMGEGGKRLPAKQGAPWGACVGGGTLELTGVHIIPEQTGERRTLLQIIPSPTKTSRLRNAQVSRAR